MTVSMLKYASFAIQEAWMAPGSEPLRVWDQEAHRRVSAMGMSRLPKAAHRHQFEYTPRPGYLYVRSRAISSRCNDNYDEFPAEEIKKGYRTFVGKPVFVNHRNDDHRRARGVIIDAALHEDTNPDGSPDVWVELLHEVDAVRFPKLAQAILAGEIDRTSMGTDVAYSVCSFCGNKAATPSEYCRHIPRMKGQRIRRVTASGEREDVLVREVCYGLKFFENSLLVEEPADPTAYFLGVEAGPDVMASRTASRGLVPVSKIKPGDNVRIGPGMDWVVTSTEPIPVLTVDGKPGVRLFFTEHPQGMSFAADYAVSVEKPGRRGLTDEEMDARAAPPTGKEKTTFGCPMCGKTVSVSDNRPKISNHTDGGTSRNRCPASGRTLDEAYALHQDEVRRQEERARWGSLKIGKLAINAVTNSKLAIGETLAPPKVDTLRDDKCPVCGESDSYSDERCSVCGFVRPPEAFQDPDTSKAQQVDMRQDQQDGQPNGGSTDPNGTPQQGQADEELTFVPPDQPEDPAAAADDPGSKEDEEVDDEEGSDEDDDPDKPDFLKKRKKKSDGNPATGARHGEGEDVTMRPALAALAEQQIVIEAKSKQIDALERAVHEIAALAGMGDHPAVQAMLVARRQAKVGVEQRIAALRRQADVDNPAQPIAEPAAEAPAATTQEALGDLNDADVTTPGSTGVTDVSPDAVTSLDDTGTVLDEPLDLNEQDPTKPVAGTTEQRPLSETKTETDVVAETGDNTSTMFPVTPAFSAQPKTSERTFASLRLARLQMAAGIAPAGDDLSLGLVIAESDRSDASIAEEITTLSKVMQVQANRPQAQPRRPGATRTAARAVPSLASSEPLSPIEAGAGSSTGISADEVLFEA